MRVMSRHAAPVSYDYHVAVAVVPAGELHGARLASADRVAPTSLEVHAGVKLCSPCEWIPAIAEDASNAHTRRNCRTLLILRIRVRLRNRASAVRRYHDR